MPIGMNLYLWCNRLEPEHFHLLSELKAAGFDGVEIPMGDYNADEVADIRAALDSEGLRCTMASIMHAEHNPIAAEAAVRQAAIDKLKTDIDMAAALGAESVVGPMHSAHKVFQTRGPDQAEFERCVEVLQAAAIHAEAADVKIAVEPLNRFECYFLNSQAQGRALADAVDSSHIGILYDTHHANIEEEDMGAAVLALGNRINHFHVSESHRGTPGTGTVNWESAFSGVKASGFDGWFVIESFAGDVPGIAEAVNIWRDCFSNKEEVYRQGITLIQDNLAG